jgi:hypothetical protein
LKDLQDYKMPHFDPLINPKSFKQQFLSGNRDNVYYCKSQDPTYTHYLGHFKGKQVAPDERAKFDQHFRTTCAGFALPDPAVMSKYYYG